MGGRFAKYGDAKRKAQIRKKPSVPHNDDFTLENGLLRL